MGCKKQLQHYAIIGGEIINKNTDYIVLSNSKTIIDTIKLDDNNRFLYKLDHVEPGVFTFKHGGEVQMVLLEPGDSLMFRLNTFDFDESLVYTGIGAKKNNYLINDFLEGEIEKKDIYKFCSLAPKAFEEKLDSIRNSKLEKLSYFNQKYNPSKLFYTIALSNIDYTHYNSKEIYPFLHDKNDSGAFINSLPNDFYAYRANINYNDSTLEDYFNYKTFLRHNINNIALGNHAKHSDESAYIWTNFCFNSDRLHAIDSLVQNSNIKNELLYHYTMGFLSKNKNMGDNDKVVSYFLEKSTDTVKQVLISTYNSALKNLMPGKPFPNLNVYKTNKKLVSINSILHKPSVIHFWSHLQKQYTEESQKKIAELSLKYPELDFLSINIDDYSINRWINTVHKIQLDTATTFMFEKPKVSIETLALYPLNKVFMLNADGTIANAHTNLFNTNIEGELQALDK